MRRRGYFASAVSTMWGSTNSQRGHVAMRIDCHRARDRPTRASWRATVVDFARCDIVHFDTTLVEAHLWPGRSQAQIASRFAACWNLLGILDGYETLTVYAQRRALTMNRTAEDLGHGNALLRITPSIDGCPAKSHVVRGGIARPRTTIT
jgi:hypothetical protein